MRAEPVIYSSVLKNDRGEPLPIVLNDREKKQCDFLQRQINALGFEVSITTLTTIVAKVSEQKFFEIAPADYVPMVVGQGSFSSNLEVFRSFSLGDDFSTGIINTGVSSSRLASADAGVDALNIQIKDWAKEITWTLIDLEKAAKSGNWDLVTEKEKGRKKNWDLGIQKVAFLGLQGDTSNVVGLLNLPGITTNPATSGTCVLQKAISSMTPAELQTLLINILNDYRTNCNYSAWPTHFAIPESDFLGLAGYVSSTFPIRSTLDLLMDTFKVMTGNPGFKILPCRYGDHAVNAGVINGSSGKQVYALYNYDESSFVMNLPVDYTPTLANSLNSFSFQNVAFGEFTGVLPIRPQEMIYYTF